MDRCKGIIGKMFGHNFQPMVSEAFEEKEKDKIKIDRWNIIFCSRCGQTIDPVEYASLDEEE